MKQKNDRNFTQEKEGQAKKGFSELPRFLGNVKDETRRQDQQKRRAPQQEKAAGQDKPAAKHGKFVKQEKQAKADKERQTERPRREKGNGRRGKVKNPVKILFLGGVGEIGKNMTAIECGNDIIIIDAGLTFPDEELPGIDLVIPDISYLVQNKQKVRGLLVTHGHEDHVGGIAYLLKEINCPVYATKLTLALADNKLREQRINRAQLICIKPGDKIKLGCFGIEFINVNHSIAGAVALAIDTPQGKIYHSGDFKIDLTPVAGEQIDLSRIAELGREGIKLLLCESTNVERPGYTMSETVDRKSVV